MAVPQRHHLNLRSTRIGSAGWPSYSMLLSSGSQHYYLAVVNDTE